MTAKIGMDIKQKGFFVAFGPNTHEDKQATLEAGQYLKTRMEWRVPSS